MALLPVDRRRNNFNEIEIALLESDAVKQAKRCLRCDYGKVLTNVY
jgi:NADH-quinone oxidoreductase subunit F